MLVFNFANPTFLASYISVFFATFIFLHVVNIRLCFALIIYDLPVYFDFLALNHSFLKQQICWSIFCFYMDFWLNSPRNYLQQFIHFCSSSAFSVIFGCELHYSEQFHHHQENTLIYPIKFMWSKCNIFQFPSKII